MRSRAILKSFQKAVLLHLSATWLAMNRTKHHIEDSTEFRKFKSDIPLIFRADELGPLSKKSESAAIIYTITYWYWYLLSIIWSRIIRHIRLALLVCLILVSPLQNFSIGKLLNKWLLSSPFFTQLEHCVLEGLYNAHMSASREISNPCYANVIHCKKNSGNLLEQVGL